MRGRVRVEVRVSAGAMRLAARPVGARVRVWVRAGVKVRGWG